MEHFYQQVNGWFDYEDIYRDMVTNASDNAHFVEVGVHLGKSAAFMAVEIANSNKKIVFDCIDPWDGRNENGHGYHNSLDQFLQNMSPADGFYNAIQDVSPDAANRYQDNSLDFVWIDAIHLYENVRADILAWLPKVKLGGYIGGHDYAIDHTNGIERAVKELLPNHTVHNGSLVGSWLYQKS